MSGQRPYLDRSLLIVLLSTNLSHSISAAHVPISQAVIHAGEPSYPKPFTSLGPGKAPPNLLSPEGAKLQPRVSMAETSGSAAAAPRFPIASDNREP